MIELTIEKQQEGTLPETTELDYSYHAAVELAERGLTSTLR